MNKPKFTITRSTVDNNDADHEGGGIFVCAKFSGDFVATSSTLSGNRTLNQSTGARGGTFIARYEKDGESVDAYLRNMTITQNVSRSGGDVEIINLPDVRVRIANSIISENRNHQSPPNNKSNLVGRVVVDEFKHNLVGTGSTILDHMTGGAAMIPPANNNILPNDTPGLEPLRSNGGPTPTHRLLNTSPTIDKGSNDLARDPITNAELTTDQRGAGFARRFDIRSVTNSPAGWVDIGAYEIGLPKVVQIIVSDSALPAHLSYNFATVVGSGEQLRTVPVGNANRIQIGFSEQVTLTGSPITVQSARNLSFYSGTVTTTATSATWTLTSGVFPDDQLILRIDDAGVTGLGGRLDGDWTNPLSLTATGTSVFPSGDYVVDADDDFIFYFTILAGDFIRSNIVDATDYVIWASFNGTTSGAKHNQGDANGDGAVNQTDYDIWSARVWNWTELHDPGRHFTTSPLAMGTVRRCVDPDDKYCTGRRVRFPIGIDVCLWWGLFRKFPA